MPNFQGIARESNREANPGLRDLAGLRRVAVADAVSRDLLLLAWGAYQPLSGLMGLDDYEAVMKDGRLASGEPFPLPVVLPVDDDAARHIAVGDDVLLQDGRGFLAVLTVEERFRRQIDREALTIYRTRDVRHPGVAELVNGPTWCLAGPLAIVREPQPEYPEPADPATVKSLIASRGWRTVVAFQTRNPIHRAHEYLHKVALELCDGLLLHPLVGWTKADDVPAPIRMASYRVLLDRYYPPERTLLAVFPAAMRYAGPREALFHALVRRNYGATHFVVGRDAAGVGDFYRPEESREMVAAWADEIGITPLTFEAAGYCPRCQAVGSRRNCPHPDEWLSMSGTEVRRRLAAGEPLPPEFMRPEVAEVLIQGLRQTRA